MAIVYRIHLLGPARVEQEGAQLRDCGSRKSLALLGYLIRQAQPVTRSFLADMFWGDKTETRGRRNLSHELSLLSNCLPGCLQADHASIRFKPTADY